MCKVVHLSNEDYDVYIGRGNCPKTGLPSKWGNPYSHKEGTLAEFKTDTRKEAIDNYDKYLLGNDELMKSLPELKHKKIGCWCFPSSCHGDILKKYVDRLEDIDKRNQLIND